jgi:2'-5' RNA ligase
MPDASKYTGAVIMELIAIDVAVLPPADVTQRAIALSATLPESESRGLRLDAGHLPHITLAQLFVRASEIEVALERIDAVVGRQPPMRLHVSGAGHSGQTVWLTIAPAPPLVDVHQRLMHELRGVERPGGTAAAFADGDARTGDVLWVASYRLKASFGSFTPHITLGHATRLPSVDAFDFDATTIAACHLGRFCSCRRILRAWTLSATMS